MTLDPYTPPYSLLLETSTRSSLMGLARNDELINYVVLDAQQKHNRDIILTLDRLVEPVGRNALGSIVVSIGPGSYTGLRVGLVVAKTLAYSCSWKLFALPTFEIIAQACHAIQPELGSLAVIADALQGAIFLQEFSLGVHQWCVTRELHITSFSSWFASTQHAKLVVVSPDQEKLSRMFPDELAQLRFLRPHPEPLLQAMCQLAQRHSPLSDSEIEQLEPLYLRGSYAEETARRTGQSNSR